MAEKKSQLEQRNKQLDKKISEVNTRISQLLGTDGEDLQRVFDVKFERYGVREKELAHLEADLAINLAEIKNQAVGGPHTIDDFARVDPPMKEMQEIRLRLEGTARMVEAQFGAKHPAALAARRLAEYRSKLMKAYRDDLESKFFIKRKPNGTSLQVKKDLSAEINAVKHCRELLADQKTDLDDLSMRVHKVDMQRAEKARLEDQRRRVTTEAQKLRE